MGNLTTLSGGISVTLDNGNVVQMDVQIVTALPPAPDPNTIYLITT